ncbi:MAG: DNA-directed RNA polymerase subunit beta' [Lachnospiraceae bacterium]|nr:DNA-directed RNA polymerase subunit beta' [Lachnospiraceae bacterium]
MAVLNGHTYQPVTFDAIRIQLASPDKIREWSRGEVTKPETINYRTLKPEKDGLFCEKIFGPTKDWECHCGKYKKIRFKGAICDRCGVEVTKASVRRERMGHIELAAPVSHIWYFKGIPSRIGLMLDLSPRVLEKVLYFASYIVLDPVNSELEKKQILSEKEYMDAREKYGNRFRVGMGAEAIKELLSEIDLDVVSSEMREELETATGQKKARLVKRLDVVEAFRESGNRPEWMIMDCIPVIPPDLRPMVQLEGGRFATSDLNDLYRRIINRNNRLKRLLELGAPDIIVRNEKRMLQEAVDALIDNGRRGRPVTGPGNRALKSLSDMLKGKNGRFRQNLLGKRVDYSGRSVIVIGPELKIYQCGVPTEMAIELFKPFVMKELVGRGISQNIKNAKKLVERHDDQIWDVLEDVIHDHPVMLNRAPTLHRLGIQAFEPILVEGKAIRLHPLVCTAFNADFDGDQMAIHLPLSQEAQAECRFLMLSPNNLLKPSDGGPVAVPGQDIVLGIYYLTQERKGDKGEGSCFRDVNEAIMAYENGAITLHSRITCRMKKTMPDGTVAVGRVESTLGRFMFNEVIPQDLGFVDRTIPGNETVLEVDKMIKKGDLKKIIEKVINIHGAVQTAEVLDRIKNIGYKFSTRSGITVSVSDMTVPDDKPKLLKEAQDRVDSIAQGYLRGIVTAEERYKQVVDTWRETDEKLTDILIKNLDNYNNIFMMADSGARGSNQQIKQLAGMRGLMSDTRQRTIELPIKSNFREGLDVLEYFMSAHGARKGLSDTALRTADSGYLTRRMVDVSQELIIRETDCCEGEDEIPGMEVTSLLEDNAMIESLRSRIVGRYACEDILDENGEVIVKKNHMITPARADRITKNDPELSKDMSDSEIAATRQKLLSHKVKIRTILTCRSKKGICARCYGANMASGEAVQVGEAVGVIAAQSIGEPGTQLTMRNFHTGGVATSTDITQGLPRVEELFEARKPKGLAIIAEFSGKVEVRDTKKKREVVVTSSLTDENGNVTENISKSYLSPFGFRLRKDVVDGAEIQAGDPITEGHVNPHDLLRIKGTVAVQHYMLHEVQKVYRLQGVDICDKHIEVIVRQMMKKVRVDEPGDSGYFPGTFVDWLEYEENNKILKSEGKEEAHGTRIMLGITKAALATDSFLSAASFQETTKVLTEAAIKGKTDNLMGLKENIIIGKLIPAGTGMKRYRRTGLNTDYQFMNREIPQDAAEEEAAEPVQAETAEDASGDDSEE